MPDFLLADFGEETVILTNDTVRTLSNLCFENFQDDLLYEVIARIGCVWASDMGLS